MKQENLSLREEVMHLKTTLEDEMLKWKKLDSTLEQISKENAELKKELHSTKKKLQTVTEEKERIDCDLEELENYTRKSSLEIHGIPEEAYKTAEDAVLKLGEALDVPISPEPHLYLRKPHSLPTYCCQKSNWHEEKWTARYIISVWTIDGKIFVKTSPSGSSVRIHCSEVRSR